MLDRGHMNGWDACYPLRILGITSRSGTSSPCSVGNVLCKQLMFGYVWQTGMSSPCFIATFFSQGPGLLSKVGEGDWRKEGPAGASAKSWLQLGGIGVNLSYKGLV